MYWNYTRRETEESTTVKTHHDIAKHSEAADADKEDGEVMMSIKTVMTSTNNAHQDNTLKLLIIYM